MRTFLLSYLLLLLLQPSSNAQTTNFPGPVGIGTTSPGFLIDVNGPGTVANFGNGTTGGIRIGDGFISKTAGAGWVWGSGMVPDGDNVRYFGHSLNRWGEVHIGNAAYSQISGVRFATDGKVGIGTTNPGAQLHLEATGGYSSGLRISSSQANSYSNITLLNSVDVFSQLSLTGPTYANGFYGSNEVTLHTSGAGGISFNAWDAAGVIRFGTGTSGANNERMRITAAGNVAIGTNDTKGFRLAVNGDAVFTRVKVQQFSSWSWPDYVFNETYTLMPLPEVEKFIRQNKHLPELPSAAQVEREGLDLGDNQATLLKKIEELTLYLIEQNKRLVNQQQQINSLEMQLKNHADKE